MSDQEPAHAPAVSGNELPEIAQLLDLAPVGALVRTLHTDVITYWSQGAEHLYGWTAAEALGQVSHTLLLTQFPVSQADVDAALKTSGQWSGELVHTRRDGRRVVVASRQSVRRDQNGRWVTLELNTDLSDHKALESDVRESDQSFRLLVDAVRDYAIFLVSPEGIVLTWNEGAQRLKGFLPEDIIGQPITRFYAPEDLDRGLPQRLLARAAAEGRAEHEGWRVRKDGSRFWANVVLTALRDELGNLRGFAKITRDLTERKQAEEARARASREEGARAAAEAAQAEVRASRDQLAAILAGVTDGITVLDHSGHMLFANDAAAQLCGFGSTAELLAASPADIVSRFELFDDTGAVLPSERLPSRLAFDGDVSPAAMVRFRTRSTGEERWSVVNATPIMGVDGGVEMVVSVFRDVTERKRAEDTAEFLSAVNLELTRTLDYRATLRRVAELAVPILADWCAVDVLDAENTGLQRLAVAHVDPAKIELARTVSEGYPPDPNAPQGVHAVMRTGRAQLLSDITDTQVEAAARDAEHLTLLRALQLRSAMTVPMIARGRTLGAITLVAAESGRRYTPADLAVANDLAVRAALAVDNARLYREAQEQAITHVELNEALTDAMRQLERALRTRDEFLASASHDLKNPIAGIIGTAQLLLRRIDRAGEVDPGRARQALERVVSIATRAALQVDDLLDVTRMQMGRPLGLDRQPTDLVRLARELVVDQQHQAERHDVRLEANVPELVVVLDERRFGRALGNLIENAVKYSPNGGLVRVEVTRDEAAGMAVLTVRDQGIGIPDDDIARIFDRFERGSNVVGVIPGTGIGLASARHIVESHGGTIDVASEVSRGTSFTIQLPLETVADQSR